MQVTTPPHWWVPLPHPSPYQWVSWGGCSKRQSHRSRSCHQWNTSSPGCQGPGETGCSQRTWWPGVAHGVPLSRSGLGQSWQRKPVGQCEIYLVNPWLHKWFGSLHVWWKENELAVCAISHTPHSEEPGLIWYPCSSGQLWQLQERLVCALDRLMGNQQLLYHRTVSSLIAYTKTAVIFFHIDFCSRIDQSSIYLFICKLLLFNATQLLWMLIGDNWSQEHKQLPYTASTVRARIFQLMSTVPAPLQLWLCLPMLQSLRMCLGMCLRRKRLLKSLTSTLLWLPNVWSTGNFLLHIWS